MRVFLFLLTSAVSIDRKLDARTGIFHEQTGPSASAGLLRAEYPLKHERFLNLAESMDSLESRAIDPMVGLVGLQDEVNYLRSYAVEECRVLVCSTQGKGRFSECADSLLSVDKQCMPGCQDHLRLWVFHRCYLIEAFDCAGNIGPNSLDPAQLSFNQNGPQTLSEFQTNIVNVFSTKGVNCECCEFSDVLSVVTTPPPSTGWAWFR